MFVDIDLGDLQAICVILRDFVEEAKSSGLIARLIEHHRIRGLTVAPPG